MTVAQTQVGSSEAMSTYVHSLPLYDYLARKLSDKISQGNFSVTPNYKAKLCAALSSLTIEQAEQIALLIIHYYFLTNSGRNPFIPENCVSRGTSRGRNLPYGIKISPSGKGFSFDIDKFPASFQALLGIYCSL